MGSCPDSTPPEASRRLYGISKRGNVYLRRMLIHGARAVLFRLKYDTGGFGQWVHRLAQRAPHNKVVVAIAKKLARHRLGRAVQQQRLSPSATAAACGGLIAVEKTLRLESTQRFPLFHRHDDGC